MKYTNVIVIDQLHTNFKKVIETLEASGNKRTNVARAIGFTTTTILNSILRGKSVLSTRAIYKLIEKFNVNPAYLFLGRGEIFLTVESEIDQMRNKIEELAKEKEEAAEGLRQCRADFKKLERRYNALIDITAVAMKLYKEDHDLDNDPFDVTGRR